MIKEWDTVNLQTIAKEFRPGDWVRSKAWRVPAQIIKITEEGVLFKSKMFSRGDTWLARLDAHKPEWVNWTLTEKGESNAKSFILEGENSGES